MTNEHTVTVKLEQTGMRGDINFSVDLQGPEATGPMPEIYHLADYLVSVYKELEGDLEPRQTVEEGDGTLYTTTLTLTQKIDPDTEESVFYSAIGMNPRIRRENDIFPDVQVLMSTLIGAYLHAIGMLDDEGNFTEELDTEMFEVDASNTPNGRTLH